MRDLMMMRDVIIRNTHPTVVSITNDRAMDGDGNLVPLDEAKIAAEITRLQAAHAATQYRRDRAAAYPPIVDQLDTLYHDGLDAWRAEIEAVKTRYPKGTV